jgi:hypothetical protein
VTAQSTGASWGLRLVLIFGVGGTVGILAFALAVAALIDGLDTTQSWSSRPSGQAVADIPADILPIYQQAGDSRGLDWTYIAAIGKIETDHGRSKAQGVHSGVNTFGCCAGIMQVSLLGRPSTWDSYGVDGNNDGKTSPYDPADAIPAAADYLKASGAPGDWDHAIFAYNHAAWYVADVKRQAELYRAAAETPTDLQTIGDTQRLPSGAPWLIAISGTGARCDSRIANDVVLLLNRYKMALGDCYDTSGHEASGEHPLGLAIDTTPGRGGSWALIDQAARDLGWREACAGQGCAGSLSPPFRFIGWNGYPGHGDPAHAGGNAHLHLSWNHNGGRPATVVQTLTGG